MVDVLSFPWCFQGLIHLMSSRLNWERYVEICRAVTTTEVMEINLLMQKNLSGMTWYEFLLTLLKVGKGVLFSFSFELWYDFVSNENSSLT